MNQSMDAARITLEIALESLDDARVARATGADRIELCAALDLGGLTPSAGALRAICSELDIPVVAMIRPRSGGFCYSQTELDVMRRDIDAALEAGAAGVVFGVLSNDRTVDPTACRDLLNRCTGRATAFHRAFDCTPDPFDALEALIDLGFRRVLTSGQQPTVAPPSQGAQLVQRLIERAAGRIEILPAGGIRASNVVQLVNTTGCTQVHAACREARVDHTAASGGAPAFGFGPEKDDARYGATGAHLLRELRRALDEAKFDAMR